MRIIPHRGRSRLTWRDLLDESLAGVAARPARLTLTTLGVVLGVAALVTTIGVGQTAAGQVEERFDAAAATRVVVEPGQADFAEGIPTARLPWDAPQRINRLAGVVAVGTFTRVTTGELVRSIPVADAFQAVEHDIPVAAVSPGTFAASHANLATGRLFDSGHDQRADPVAVLGRYAAERLGINRVDAQPSIFIGDQQLTVIGLLDTVASRAALLDAVIIPNGTARALYSVSAPDTVEIRTESGAAQLVGRQAPIALNPNQPEALRVQVPPRPGELRANITADVNAFFLILGGVALLVGGVGIANITLLSVLERIAEIGLRRALGATRIHIAGQFLTESIIVGLLGGLIGTATGVLITVGVSTLQNWTALLDLRLTIGAPFFGAIIGLAAGAYPAWRASAIEPITALRQTA